MKQYKSIGFSQQFESWERKFNELLVESAERRSWNVLLRKNCEEGVLKLLLWDAVWHAQKTPHRPRVGEEFVRMRRIALLSAQLQNALLEKWGRNDLRLFHEVLDFLDRVRHEGSGLGHDRFPDFFSFLRFFALVTKAVSPGKLRFDSRKHYFPFLNYVEKTTLSRNIDAAWNLLRLAFRAINRAPPDLEALERGYRREKKEQRSKTARGGLDVMGRELLKHTRRGQL